MTDVKSQLSSRISMHQILRPQLASGVSESCLQSAFTKAGWMGSSFYDKTEFIQQLNTCLSVRFSCAILFKSIHTHSVLFFSTQREIQAELLNRLSHTLSIFAFPFPPSLSSLSALSLLCKWKGTEGKRTLSRGSGNGGEEWPGLTCAIAQNPARL